MMKQTQRRRITKLIVVAVLLLAGGLIERQQQSNSQAPPQLSAKQSVNQLKTTDHQKATEGLELLAIKGRAPKTGYSRDQFGEGWAITADSNCDTRNLILQRDLQQAFLAADQCTVNSGQLADPYTGQQINFRRGTQTSQLVQIDHVVALSDAWQKGAQLLTPELRQAFANDPLNLLAVDGPTNQHKSDSDAATWLPPQKSFRCAYAARQIAVKISYSLWLTLAEKQALASILQTCPKQQLPTAQTASLN